jgi:hypothetical protein
MVVIKVSVKIVVREFVNTGAISVFVAIAVLDYVNMIDLNINVTSVGK